MVEELTNVESSWYFVVKVDLLEGGYSTVRSKKINFKVFSHCSREKGWRKYKHMHTHTIRYVKS